MFPTCDIRLIIEVVQMAPQSESVIVSHFMSLASKTSWVAEVTRVASFAKEGVGCSIHSHHVCMKREKTQE